MRYGKGWGIGWIAAVAIGGIVMGEVPARAEGNGAPIKERLRGVTLPQVYFRGADLIDVLSFFRQALASNAPDGSPLEFVVQTGGGRSPHYIGAAGVLRGEIPPQGLSRVTLSLRRVNAYDAIRFVAVAAGLGFALEDARVVIGPLAEVGRPLPDAHDAKQADRLLRRMQEIVIPSIEFRRARLDDVIEFLQEAAIPADPNRIGANIVRVPMPSTGPGERPDPMIVAPPGGDWGNFDSQASDPSVREGRNEEPVITLSLRRVTLLDAIRYVSDVVGLSFAVVGDGVVVGRMEDLIGVSAARDLEQERARLEARQESAARLQARMERIVIPSIEFRDAAIVDVMDFLHEASVANCPDYVGVNFVLHLNRRDSAASISGTTDAPSVPLPTLTLSLRHVTLLEVVRQVTESAGLKFSIEGAAVVMRWPEAIPSP